MDISTGAQHVSRYPAAGFNEKGCLQVWGWRCPNQMFDIVVCKETQSKADIDLYSFQGQNLQQRYYTLTMNW
jgi:hypothetical protein